MFLNSACKIKFQYIRKNRAVLPGDLLWQDFTLLSFAWGVLCFWLGSPLPVFFLLGFPLPVFWLGVTLPKVWLRFWYFFSRVLLWVFSVKGKLWVSSARSLLWVFSTRVFCFEFSLPEFCFGFALLEFFLCMICQKFIKVSSAKVCYTKILFGISSARGSLWVCFTTVLCLLC